jgi:hypothetical protein
LFDIPTFSRPLVFVLPMLSSDMPFQNQQFDCQRYPDAVRRGASNRQPDLQPDLPDQMIYKTPF